MGNHGCNENNEPNKALGPNGFQPLFYQKYWQVVGPAVHQLVCKAFDTSTFDSSINDTLLVLIPKSSNTSQIKDFRSISLYNVLYKIIIKVLVNRFKPFMAKLVNPLQANFVSGDALLIILL